GPVAERALHELERDAQGDEAGGVGEPRARVQVELAEPEHHAGVGEQVPDLVAVLDRNLRRVMRYRGPDDDGDQSPAHRQIYRAHGRILEERELSRIRGRRPEERAVELCAPASRAVLVQAVLAAGDVEALGDELGK